MPPKQNSSVSLVSNRQSSENQSRSFRIAKSARTIWQIAALAALSLTTGCLGDSIYVDERFTPDEVESIKQGAEAWNAATDGKANVDLVFGQRVDIQDTGRRVMVRSSGRAAENVFELFRDGDPGGRHSTWDAEVIVLVPERMDGIDLKYVVTHEFGHHFGVHHVADESAIMYYRPGPKSAHCLTREDLTAFCGANACNPEAMHACDDSVLQ